MSGRPVSDRPVSEPCPPSELERNRITRLLVVAVLCLALLAVLYVVAVHTSMGQRIDDAAVEGRTLRHSVLQATDRVLNTISVASLALGGVAIMLVALVRERPHLALAAGVVIVGANITTQILKTGILDRPDLVGQRDPLGVMNTFPSGHSTVAMSLAVALVLVVPTAARAMAAFGGLVYATLVGAGTVTAGWHRPSDAIAAYLIVMAWAGISVAVLIDREGAVPDPDRAPWLAARVPSMSPFLVGTGVGALGGALAGVAVTLVATREGELHAVRLSSAYAASIVTIVACAVALMVALLWIMRGVALDQPTDVSRAAPRGTAQPAH